MLLEPIFKYPVVFVSSFLVALAVVPLWKKVAPGWGFIDQPGGRKIHASPIPVGGGISIFMAFHAACAVIFLSPWRPFAGQLVIDWWFRFIPLSIGVVLLGLIDDRYGMNPRVKLLGQFALASAAYFLHIRIQNVMGMDLPVWVDFCGTVLWFLAIMNSFNLIDGVDGLASGIATIASAGLAVSLVFRQSPGDVLLFVGFAGACLGFLRYNFYPATVFLGDTGSLFIGFSLAALTISTNSKGSALAAIGMPLLAVGVPLFDTVLAIWRRVARRLLTGSTDADGSKVAVDQGDADHLHHRLLRQGRKHDQVAWLLYIATALLTLTGILTTLFNDRALGILGLAFVVSTYVIFRHLAWIEMRDTSELIMRGIAKPVRRNLSLLFYVVIDISILNMAWIASVVLMHLSSGGTDLNLKESWLKAAPVDMTIPFMLLLLFHAYSRVWSLAGIREYVTIGLATLAGGFVACAVTFLRVPPHTPPWNTLLHYVLMMGMATPAIVGVRAVFRLAQTGFHLPRLGRTRTAVDCERALIFGGGCDVMLFLRHWASSNTHSRPVAFSGIVSPDDAIKRHSISGIPVLGNEADLPVLIQKKKIEVLYLLGNICTDEHGLLDRVCDNTLRVVHWRVVEEEISCP